MSSEVKNIEEKLSNLELLANFSWTPEWFALAQKALLDLSQRGEDEKPIIDFVRDKVVSTDVRSFNKFLQSQTVPLIKNHYDMLLEDDLYVNDLVCNNDNDAIIDHIISVRGGKNRDPEWSSNQNPKMIKHLIATPGDIDWDRFSANPNDAVVDYIFQNLDKVNYKKLCTNTNQRVVEYLIAHPKHISSHISGNSNELATVYCLKNKRLINNKLLCTNTNDNAVRYLISNPRLIFWPEFLRNPNDIAVEHILKNVDKIDVRSINANHNPKITQYLIDHPNQLDEYQFVRRTDSLAISYIFSGKLKLGYGCSEDADYNTEELCRNPNELVTEFAINYGLYCGYTIASNNCNYVMQKLRTFNSLRLFPHLLI